MDSELSKDNPYNNMDTGEKEITPEFLKSGGEKGKGVLAAAENVASAAVAAKTGKAPVKNGEKVNE